MTDRNRPSKAVDDLRRLAEDLASQVGQVEARRAAFRAIAAGRRRSRYRLWVVGLAAIGVLVVSNVALAAASNPAVPGDPLYSLDRGYEWLADLFVPQDHSAERIAEAEELIAEGESAVAVSLLGEAVASVGGEEALEAASAAVEAANSVGLGPDNSEIEAAVEDLVEATKDITAAALEGDPDALRAAIELVRERAKEVSEAAKAQGGNPNSTSDQPNPGVTAPGRVDGDSQGQGQGQGRGQGQG